MRLRLYPDPVLRRRAKPVPLLTPEAAASELVPRVEEMFEIMDQAGGIGLAAPQAGWSVRIFVTQIPVGEAEGDRRVYINPVVLEASGSEEDEEGCLSFPHLRGRVARHTSVRIRARDLSGAEFEETAVGLAARCWQHEIDHLDGILFTSRMSAGDLLQIKQGLRDLEEDHAKKRASSGRSARA